MSASIKDTLKKKINQAQNKAIFNKYGTPDVVATIKGKKVEYGNQTNDKKTQNNNRPKKSAVQTLSSTKKAQVTQQQKAKSKLGTDKKGYTVTDSNKVMQNYANKTGSYDVNKYKKDTFDKQKEQQEKAKKIVNNIKKGDTLNSATKKAGQAVKNTGKFLTDFDYRNKVGEKALIGAGTALSQFSKGALKTVENWGDAARSATDDFNNWVAYKTGIIDKKEYERQKDITRKSIAADAVGDFWKNNLGWNEENAQTLKDYSYVTEDNLLGQLSYGLGQQAPALMIGNTQAVQNLMTNPALQSVAGDGAVKNIARGLIRNAPMNAEIGLRSYGGAVEEALQNGATMEQARRYGLLNAGTEIATEWMTGGIPGVENTTGLFDKGVDAVIDKATGKLTKETSKAIAKSLLSYGFDALGEGLEESVSEIFSPLIKNMTYSNGEKIDWNNVLNAGIMGMLQGGILNAPSAVTNARSDISQARQIDRANREAARQQAEQQAREELNTAAQSRLNEVYQQQQEQTPIFNQQNRLRELAQQQVDQIEQQVQSGQISPQDGIQQIQDIQRYIQSQETQTEQTQEQPVTPQETTQTAPTINETTQDNTNTQEEQNVAQNENNEVENYTPEEQAFIDRMERTIDIINKNANENHPALTEKQMQEMRDYALSAIENRRNETTKNVNKENIAKQSDAFNLKQEEKTAKPKSETSEETRRKGIARYGNSGLWSSISKEEFIRQNYLPNSEKEYGLTREQVGEMFDNSKTKEYKQLYDKMTELYRNEDVKKAIPLEERQYYVYDAYDKNKTYAEMEKDLVNAVNNATEQQIKQAESKNDLKEVVDKDLYDVDIDKVNNQFDKENYNLDEDGFDELDQFNFELKNGNIIELSTPHTYKKSKGDYIPVYKNRIDFTIYDKQGNVVNESYIEGKNNNFTKEEIVDEIKRLTYDDSNKQADGQIDMFGNVHVSKTSDNVETAQKNNAKTTTNKEAYNSKPKEGTIRLYTNTSAENIDSILKNGLDVSKAKQNEYEGNMTWFETRPDLKGYGGTTIAVDVPSNLSMDKVNDTQYTVYDNISPENIAFIDKPVMNNYRTSDMEELLNKYGKEKVTQVFDRALENGKASITKEEFNDLVNSISKETNQQNDKNVNLPETKTEPVIKFDNETKKQTAKQITDVLNKNLENNENADIFDTIEKDTGKKLRGFVKTATNATGDVDLVSKMDKVKITYDQLSNKETMKQAENYFKDMKYQDGVEDVLDFIKSDKRVTALDMAKIDYMVLQAKARNDMRTYQNLVEEAGIIATQSGQVSQAVSLIQQSDPMFQLSVLNRLIQKEQENGTKQFKGVKIKENLVEKVMDSYDENGNFDKKKFDKAMDKLKQDIANQMKVTPMEKADAWRYLSMLGNPKTHIRNVVANVAMKILQGTKNKIAAGGEALVDVGSKAISGKGIQRTKTLMPSTRDVKSFSVQTMEDYFNKSKPESKYNDKITNQKGLKGELLQRRNKFNNKNPFGFLLNLADKGNSALLNLEDNVFNKSAAKSAMANYLTANGVRTQADIDAHPDIVQAAFDYGILQGNEATFHQKSTTADVIRQSREKLRTGSGLSKTVGYGIDATMPFVSTPINIAKTGVEYTPGLGLLKTITDVQQAPKAQKASVLIDSLSKQLSGGLLAYAGYLLAKNGWLVGGGDDDSEKKLEKNLGAMNYAIKVGNDYYDISFLSPSAMPLLMGANLNEALKGKGVKENVIADVLYQSLDPLTEMSFMSSVQDVLKSYNSGAKGLSDMGSSALTGYISQYIPTLMSQFASSRDKYKRSTGGNTFIEKTKQKLMKKIPGQREKLPEQVNVWGEAKENKQRGLEAFLNPMNRSTAKVDDTTKEIEKIYEETGTGMPNMGIKKDQLGNTLNEKEYTQFKKTYGKTAKKELDDLIKSSKYKNASTEEKAAMITRIYSYSTHKSKEEYSNESGAEYEPQTKYYAMIDAFDIPFNEYVQMGLEDIKADKGSNGKSISGSKKTKVIKAIEESGLTKVQKQAIIKQKGYKTSKNDDYELKKAIYSSNLSDEEKNRILEYLKLK